MKDELLITPGEWKEATKGPNGCPVIGAVGGVMVAMLAHSINHPDQKEQAVANAKLIAEAGTVYNETKLSPRQMVERIKALELDRDNLRAFIENIIKSECWNRVEYLDGGDVQDEAVRMGILGQVPHVLPCSEEFCGCEGEEVDHLYQFTWK